jgi:hypothetical protein
MMVSHAKFFRRSAMMHVALETNIGSRLILNYKFEQYFDLQMYVPPNLTQWLVCFSLQVYSQSLGSILAT